MHSCEQFSIRSSSNDWPSSPCRPDPSAEQRAHRAEMLCARTSRGTRYAVDTSREASHLEVQGDCHDTSRIVRGKPKRSPTLDPRMASSILFAKLQGGPTLGHLTFIYSTSWDLTLDISRSLPSKSPVRFPSVLSEARSAFQESV